MSELHELLPPGTVIGLSDITQLPKVEDAIAFAIDPRLDPAAWEARENLRDLVRPPKFNGSIVNIVLEVMDEPYEQLRNARERGWKFIGSGSHHGLRTTEESRKSIDKYVGLKFMGEAQSTGRGMIGQIQAEMWYTPISARTSNDGSPTEVLKIDGGRTVKRFITRPRFEEKQFYQLRSVSRRIGYEVLKASLSNSITTAVRDTNNGAHTKKNWG